MSVKVETVLVTGGAGFIGSHLIEELVKNGYQVRVLDILSRGSLTHIQPQIDSGKIDFIDGDIRYKDIVDKAMKGVDYVFHLAATNINRSSIYPEESFDVNFRGSQVVFKSALDHSIKKVIFASSASVYGQPKKLPMSENDELDPITPYCVSKLASEHLLKFYSRHGLKYTIFRFFNVYGLRQHTDAYYTSVIIHFIKKIINGESPVIDGDGSQSMDFINVKDIVRASILSLESDCSNQILNLGSGRSTSVKTLASIIINLLDVDIEPIFVPREIIVTERKADIIRAKELLGFETETSMEEGLKEVVADVVKNPDMY